MIERCVDLLRGETVTASLLGCLINLSAESVANVMEMIRCGVGRKIEEVLMMEGLDTAIHARSRLLLTHVSFYLTPIIDHHGPTPPSLKELALGEAKACLYDRLKQEATEDNEHLTQLMETYLAEKDPFSP